MSLTDAEREALEWLDDMAMEGGGGLGPSALAETARFALRELGERRTEPDGGRVEAWRAGYESAVELVRIAAQVLPGADLQRAMRGMVRTLNSSRDEMETRDPALGEKDRPEPGGNR